MDRKTVKEVLKEERRKKRASKSRRRIKQAFALISCLLILVLVMYGGLTIYSLYQERVQETVSNNVSGLDLDDSGNLVYDDGNVVNVVSDAVVYSQEELDARVAEAVLAAQNQGMEEVLDAIREGLSDGDTVIDTLRPFYPDHVIVASSGKYHFVPINYQLAQSQLLTENLNILESGEIQYMIDGDVVSYRGIDVSKFQGNIDWTLVAQDGVEFAFIRVGYRGYGSAGKLVEDERFDANVQGALAAGIKVGVYFYSQAITEEEALEEADFVLNKIASYNIECPVVFDVEKVSAGGRMDEITVEERTNLTKLFCQAIENAGYRPMIYHNTEWGILALDLTALEGYDKWFAAYTDTLYYPYEYKVWQYSDTGKVQGINTDVDLNISFVPLWE